jgi:hypothetical protein
LGSELEKIRLRIWLLLTQWVQVLKFRCTFPTKALSVQDCQIFLGPNIPKREKIFTKWSKNIPNGHTTFNNVYHSKDLLILPRSVLFGLKINRLATLFPCPLCREHNKVSIISRSLKQQQRQRKCLMDVTQPKCNTANFLLCHTCDNSPLWKLRFSSVRVERDPCYVFWNFFRRKRLAKNWRFRLKLLLSGHI